MSDEEGALRSLIDWSKEHPLLIAFAVLVPFGVAVLVVWFWVIGRPWVPGDRN